MTGRPTILLRALAALATLLLAASCTTQPEPQDHFRLGPESAARRALQTRRFDTGDRDELLSASAAALQDLGFHVTECDRELGFLRGSKERSAREYGQDLQRVLVMAASLGKLWMPIDLHQRIAASLVIQPIDPGTAGEPSRHEVRVTFHRVVWKGSGQVDRQYIPPGDQRYEHIDDPTIHQAFFARLSKAVFLEAQQI